MQVRDFDAIARRIKPTADRTAAMQQVVDALWDGLAEAGVSWVGFYLKTPGAEEMTLGPRRDKPACSPIGLHGVCGQAYLQRRTRIVRDVKELGADYVACDPRDRSELVLPLFEVDGSCWGVLDFDSFEVGAFDESDQRGAARVLQAAGFRCEA